MTTPRPTPPAPGAPAPPPPPDRPPVPRTAVSWLVRIYAGVTALALVVYLLAGVMGWDFKSSERDRVPGSVRNSPGGYRSFWIVGYRGGK